MLALVWPVQVISGLCLKVFNMVCPAWHEEGSTTVAYCWTLEGYNHSHGASRISLAQLPLCWLVMSLGVSLKSN